VQILSTDEGTEIDRNEEQYENAKSSRLASLMPALKVTFERLLQWLKQNFEILSIDEGIQIDSSEE
jgi:hypothetical protein